MHVVLAGPAGTGKTTLAHLVADLAQQAMLCTGYLPATATAEWSVAQTIGSIQDTAEGHVFLPGMVLESIESGCWLVIDELNRADVDSALGELPTAVPGQPVVLPFKRPGGVLPLSLVPAGAAPPADTAVLRVPAPSARVYHLG